MPKGVRKPKNIDDAVETELNALLYEVKKTGEDGKPAHSLTDRCKVLDRALKWQAIKAKLTDTGYGSGFGAAVDEPEQDDDNPTKEEET